MPNATTTLKIASKWLNYVGAIPFIVLGIVGAILTVTIFTKQRLFWRNASITYLLAGAAVTGIHLPMVYTQNILMYGFGFILSRNAAFRNRWSSIRVARWAIVGTVIFWTIVYLPLLFVSGVVDGLCVLKSGVFTRFNTYFLTPFVYSVGPLTIMIVFTLGTIQNLRSAHVFRKQSHLARQVRRMLIPQLIVLGVSGIPFGFQGIYLELTNGIKKDSFRLTLEDFFGQVILLLFHCNYVFTFYIYFYTSSEVRKALKDLIFKCIRRNTVAPIDTTAHTHTHCQTLTA
ncbi:unnamed protein product [Adineta steineri]|uniref:G-protein coupled receptors family 1 profile domain-containing protein n=1 Tax=Adineta steineri TaxID=433720 RepID=A0A813SD86_9BILA|nr:unnamed protein product [Adineta steineri]CAF4019809.1 unnamed protein product [Adineta steineri]